MYYQPQSSLVRTLAPNLFFFSTHQKLVELASDYWYYKIGANVIPADTKIKQACILKCWKQYQSNPVLSELFERWKESGLFTYGIGVVLGPLQRGKNAGKSLNLIDADNRLGLQEICSWNGKTTLEQLASWTELPPNQAPFLLVLATKMNLPFDFCCAL
jgi:hypothetical protein